MFAKQFLRTSMRQQPIMMTQYQRRFFDLHEFQSKYIMGKYGVNVQKGAIALNENDAAKIATGLSNKGGLILKAQVKAGGRGKGKLTSGLKGGVKICKTPEEIKDFTKQMIGYNLITHQTPPEGLLVKSVLVHEGVDIDKQLYLAILHDRKNQALCVVSSTKGGMDIEEVAKEDPDAIKIHSFDIRTGLTKESAAKIVDSLELPAGKLRDQGIDQLQKLYQMFIKLDATQIEVNPWAITPEKDIYCVDAKINIDDNALFRQQELLDMYKQGASLTSAADQDDNEEKAIAAGLNYIALDGNIGCMVNGAGLAMATMDIIQLKGGKPANFLDVGGGANTEQVKTAFEILSRHPKVKAIFVNIFGGIMKCDTIAQGIINAASQVKIDVPVVVRLTGTNADKAFTLLDDFSKSGKGKVQLIVNPSFDSAAQNVIDQAAK